MKKLLYILLSFISIQATAQIEQPRIKLNQVIKDTLSGRFVMSSLIDSSLTYESVLTTDGNLLYLKNQPYVSGGVNSIEYIFEASSNISQGQAVAINTNGKVSSVVTSDRTVITDSDLDLFMLSKNIPSTANHIINLSTAYKYTSLDWTNKMINISGRLGIVARNPDTVGYLNILDFDGALENSNLITSSLTKDELTQYGLVSRETERNISIIPLDTVNNPSTSYTNNKWLALYKNGVGRTYTQLNKNSSNGWPAFSGIEYPILQYVTINNSPSVVVTHFTSGGSSFGSKYPTYHVNIHKLNNNKLIATLFEANDIESEESVRVVQGTIISNTVSDSIHWDSYYDYPNSEPHPYIDIENMNPSRGHSVYVPDENKVTIVSVVETGSLVDVVANIVAKTVYIQADTLVQTNLDTLLEIYSFNNLNINVGSFKDKIVVVKSTVGNPALAEYFQDFYVFTLNNGVITAPTNYTRVGPYTVPSKNVQMVYDYQINKLIVGIDNGLFAGTYNATTGTLIFGPTTYTDYNIDEITFNYNKDNSDYTRIAVLHADEKKIGLYDVSLSNIYNFIGFSKDNIPAGSLGTVTLLGGVNTYQDSLSPGRSYYINTEGNLQLDYSISGVVGKALTDTSILVTYIGVGNPNYIDENINIVDINPITNILTNETTPLTATRTTNTTTLDITEATSTTDGYITSEYKVQLDNLLSNSYLDTIRTDNTLTYTEITTDSVLLTVDTTVIATVNYVNANTGLWQDTSDLVELKIQTPVKVPSYDQDSIDIAGWSTNDFVSGIFVGEEQTKSGALFFDHTQSLSVSNLAPNTGILTTHAGVLKYVAPEYDQFTMQYNGGYNAYIIPSTWYVDNKVSQALNNAKWSVYNTGLQQGTGIIISPLTYSATISVDTSIIATQAYVDANAGGSAGLGTFQESFVANGTDSVYTLTSPGATLPTSEDNILVLQNGIVLDNDLFTKTSSTSIQLSFLPAANDRVVIVYFTGGDTGGTGASSGVIFQQVFIADGIDSSYTVDGELPINAKDIIVTRNGLVLDTAFIESLTTNTVTLSFLPNAGNRINVIWFEVGRDTTWNKNVDDIYYTAGNVGIGTTAPGDGLSVGQYETPTLALRQKTTIGVYGDTSAYFRARDITRDIEFLLGTSINGSVFAGSMTNHNMTLRTGNQVAMTIDTFQNVGIGTTSPNVAFQVDTDSLFAVDDVNDRIYINGTLSRSLFPTLRGVVEVNGATNEAAFRYNGGFINETNDFGFLSKSTSLGNKRVQYIFYDRNNVQTGKFGVDVAATDDDDFQIVAGSGSTPQFHLEANGNVGIGTTSPGAKFTVVKDSNPANQTSIASTAIFASDNPGTLAMVGYVGADNTVGGPSFNGFKARNTVASPQAAQSGDIGLGVAGYFWDTSVASDWKYGSSIQMVRDAGTGSQYRVPGYIKFSTSQASDNNIYERMRITPSGNVGIGTSSPTSTLTVGGQTSIRNDGLALGETTLPLIISNLSANLRISITSATGGNVAYTDFFTYSGGTGQATSTGFTFTTRHQSSTQEKMRIASNGELWIAGTTDRGSYNLQVNGTGVWGQGSYVNGSDIKLKENIKPINSGLYYVNKLKPVEYNYKPIYSSDPSRQLGFIAQDVIFALEDLSDAVVKDNGDIYSMAYQNLIPLAVKAIQEQQAIIETQNTKITELETALQALINRVEQLEQ